MTVFDEIFRFVFGVSSFLGLIIVVAGVQLYKKEREGLGLWLIGIGGTVFLPSIVLFLALVWQTVGIKSAHEPRQPSADKKQVVTSPAAIQKDAALVPSIDQAICYTRRYTSDHLQKNPQQIVEEISIQFTTYQDYPGQTYHAVRLVDRSKNIWLLSGNCHPSQETKTTECSSDDDRGRFWIEIHDKQLRLKNRDDQWVFYDEDDTKDLVVESDVYVLNKDSSCKLFQRPKR